MTTKIILLSIANILALSPAWAIDKSNQSNVSDLKSMLFADDAKTGTITTQKGGKTTAGADCTVTVSYTRFGVSLSINAGPSQTVSFRASISGKASQNYSINDSDENMLDVSQTEVSKDERGSYANQETLQFLTEERPGDPQVNNIQEIEITSQFTDQWKAAANGKSTPDFTKSSPATDISCEFTATP